MYLRSTDCKYINCRIVAARGKIRLVYQPFTQISRCEMGIISLGLSVLCSEVDHSGRSNKPSENLTDSRRNNGSMAQ